MLIIDWPEGPFRSFYVFVYCTSHGEAMASGLAAGVIRWGRSVVPRSRDPRVIFLSHSTFFVPYIDPAKETFAAAAKQWNSKDANVGSSP